MRTVKHPALSADSAIDPRILVVRGERVILDDDLAKLYGVAVGAFNQAVRRNRARFPADFMFQLTAEEWDFLRSQFVILKGGRGGHRKYLPYAFTEHGAVQAANVLRSRRAMTMSVHVVRAFVRMRQALAVRGEFGTRLRDLERALLALDLKTDARFEEMIEALRSLMQPPEKPKRPMGFVPLEERKPDKS